MYNKYKSKLSIFLAAVFITSSLFVNAIVVNAATINDLDKSSAYAKEAIAWMASNNVISGDKQGNFNPAKSISRPELVTLLVKALEIDMSNLPTEATFSDVPTNHWAYKYVEAANKVGLVSGIGNGKFGVNNKSTREQITAMLMNYFSVSKEAVLAEQGLGDIAKFKDEGNMSDWAKPSIQFVVYNKLMSGISTDTFSPKGTATKEQIAVILFKLLKSKELLQQNVQALKKPIVTFNGDILKLTLSPEIENNEILVPLEVFEKIGADVTVEEQTNKVIIKSSTTLNITPVKIGTEFFVPVKAVVDAIGMSVNWNTKTNLVSIQDSTTVKNPLLYNALKNSLQYKGELSSSISMSIKESKSNEEFGMFLTMNSAINGLNSTTNSKFSVKITGMPDQNYEYDTINIADEIYLKDLETAEWSIIDSAEAIDQGIMYYDVLADRVETQKLLDSYGKMNIIPEGKTTLNGEEVSKYQIKMSSDVLDEFIPSDMIESGLGLEDIYNKGLNYKVEIFINNKGQLVKQTAQMAGLMEIDGYSIVVNIAVDTKCFNIGKEIEIVRPILKP